MFDESLVYQTKVELIYLKEGVKLLLTRPLAGRNSPKAVILFLNLQFKINFSGAFVSRDPLTVIANEVLTNMMFSTSRH